MTTLTRYEQVREKVLPRLVAYHADLIDLDKNNLEGYEGGFIHASRDSGTDLMRFTGGHGVTQFDWATQFLFRSGSNNLFLFGDADGVREISREEALARVQAYMKIAARDEALRQFEDLPNTADRSDMVDKRYSELLPEYRAIFAKL